MQSPWRVVCNTNPAASAILIEWFGLKRLSRASRRAGSLVEIIWHDRDRRSCRLLEQMELQLEDLGCFAHAWRKFFELADVAAGAREKSRGEQAGMIYPIALEAVRRLDTLFDIEREINGTLCEIVADQAGRHSCPTARLRVQADRAQRCYLLRSE